MRSRVREPGALAAPGAVPLSVPNISGNEWTYVRDCLDTGWVSSAGPYVDRFERTFAEAVGVRHAVAVASGTAALHVALLVSGIEPGVEVILPALTFIAPANAVRYTGAWPTFVDVEEEYAQIDPVQIEAFLREDCRVSQGAVWNRRTGRRVAAILPVDLLGHPCDLDRIQLLATEFGLAVIEDATESLGATYRGRMVGSRGPIAIFSFNGNKLLTTGGGGLIATDDEAMATRARYLTTQAKDDPVEFVHRSVGYNYRLSNIQAAIGCAQLEQLGPFADAKRRIARRYEEELRGLPGITAMRQASWATSAFWMYTLLIDAVRFGSSSRDLLEALEREGIQTRPLWQPLHLSPAHQASFARPCPVAETWQREALSLPCSTGLTGEQQTRVIDAIREQSRISH